MTYYRLIFRTSPEGRTEWTEIIEDTMSDTDFQSMNWDRPIIRHVVGEQTHFLSLDSNYLEAMILGIKTFRDHATTSQEDTSVTSTPTYV